MLRRAARSDFIALAFNHDKTLSQPNYFRVKNGSLKRDEYCKIHGNSTEDVGFVKITKVRYWFAYCLLSFRKTKLMISRQISVRTSLRRLMESFSLRSTRKRMKKLLK